MANSFQNLFKSKYIIEQKDINNNPYDLKYFYEVGDDGKRWLRFYIPWFTKERTLVIPIKDILILGEDVNDPTLVDIIPSVKRMYTYDYVKRKYNIITYNFGVTNNDTVLRINFRPGVKGPSMGEIALQVSVPPPKDTDFDMISGEQICR